MNNLGRGGHVASSLGLLLLLLELRVQLDLHDIHDRLADLVLLHPDGLDLLHLLGDVLHLLVEVLVGRSQVFLYVVPVQEFRSQNYSMKRKNFKTKQLLFVHNSDPVSSPGSDVDHDLLGVAHLSRDVHGAGQRNQDLLVRLLGVQLLQGVSGLLEPGETTLSQKSCLVKSSTLVVLGLSVLEVLKRLLVEVEVLVERVLELGELHQAQLGQIDGCHALLGGSFVRHDLL